MKLKLVKVRGYKRFAERQSLDTRGSVVAVVGPNEAGKTSLLEAMKHLSTGDGFHTKELTDRTSRPNDDWIVSAHFSLEPEDRQALGPLLPAGVDITYMIFKYPEGNYTWAIDPPMSRDTTVRQRAVKSLRDIARRDWLDEVDDSDETEASLRSRSEALADDLDTTDDWLSEGAREEMTDLVSEVDSKLTADSRKSLTKFVELLKRTHAAEEVMPPDEQVEAILSPRQPKFLLFRGEELELATDYVWAENTVPPPALANLFALAGVDYQSMRQAATTDDRAKLDMLKEGADVQLNDAFKAWRQGDLHVTLSPNAQSLQLLIRDRTTAHRTRLDERSDGLRRFVALVAFTATHGGDAGVRPVLLIDEAETHLHYGAQADLVRVLERQQAAETVVYTTHSIGCLPTDLGGSIRVVSPAGKQRYRSTISTSVWAAEGRRVGMTPMMLAMGATALAFTPSRRAVIGEGPTEAILLPSLIREALALGEQDEPLDYQVVPGVSEVDPRNAADLEMEAGAVAYLVDDDAGGRAHTRKLPKRAKEEGRVIILGGGNNEGLCTEDLVEAEVLAKAVNSVLDHHSRSKEARLSSSKLPGIGRGAYIEKWGLRCHGFRLNKVSIAQEALELGRQRGELLQRKRKQTLLAVHKSLLRATSRPEDTPAA